MAGNAPGGGETGAGPGPARMLFLVGRGRSGTTLLKAMLDAHPQVSVAPEALFVMNAYRRYHKAPWSRRRVAAFGRDLWRERKLHTWELDEGALAGALDAVPDPDFAVLCRTVYARYAAEHGKLEPRWLGDKNPHYALFLPELMGTFPDARFVHIVRDYRDNILSYRSVRFDLNHTAALAYRWRWYNEAVLRAAAAHPDRFHRLRYEDLVSDPEPTLEALCGFLEVRFDPAMLSYHESYQGEARSWHAALARPPDPGRLNQWRERMTPAAVAHAESVCGALGEQLGYARTGAIGGSRPARAWGLVLGWTQTRLERVLFALPMGFRARVLAFYRLATGSLTLDGRSQA